MLIVYADPPYFGCGKKLYNHPEWDEESTHINLIYELLNHYDGFALSCNPKDLKLYLSAMPVNDFRVAAWCKTWHQIRPTGIQYAWEPVILHGGRKTENNPMIRDWLACPATKMTGTKGAKPPEFCFWVFKMLGLEPQDKFIDLFPGSGNVSAAWDVYRKQQELLI